MFENSRRYLEEAERLGRVLIGSAAPGEGGPAWPEVPGDLRQPERLFDGRPGVGFFLAALDRASPGHGFAEAALEALEPLRRLVRDGSAAEASLGVGLGLGGWIYTLVRTGLWLDRPDLVGDARTLAASLLPARVAEDAMLDVIGGAAGAVLGLLVLHRETGDANVLATAAACGRHLLDRSTVPSPGRRAWVGMLPRLAAGFSHGAAGIALALTRLYRATGETAFLAAAREAIEWEQELFDPEAGNWRSFQSAPGEEPPPFRVAWCHGAPGIGLARLGCLPDLDATATRAEIDTAVETTHAFATDGPDHLCCGALGSVELLVTAGERLGEPEWSEAGHELALRVMREAREERGYLLDVQDPGRALRAGLFQGVSGIGYQMLRLADPARYPSLLLLE